MEELLRLIGDRGFTLVSGYLALIIGLATVILHNVWVADWRVVITVFGWLSLLKGIVRIGFPEITQKFAPTFRDKLFLTQILLVVAVILGGWLVWMSY